jgi:hypothetical protein
MVLDAFDLDSLDQVFTAGRPRDAAVEDTDPIRGAGIARRRRRRI